MPPPANLSELSRAALEARFVELLSEVSELRRIVMAQRDEIVRLKGLKGRPSITVNSPIRVLTVSTECALEDSSLIHTSINEIAYAMTAYQALRPAGGGGTFAAGRSIRRPLTAGMMVRARSLCKHTYPRRRSSLATQETLP